MPLPDFTNQSNINTLTTALKFPDAEPIMRVKLKRRYVSGNVDQYDTNWTTITSDIIDIGSIKNGIDDQEWIQGVTKIGAVNLVMDNTERKYNDRTDSSSLWHDPASVTNYYIPNSLVEIEMGYELPTGTQFFDTFHSGLLRGDSLNYHIRDNNVGFSVMSKLEWLKSVNIFDTTKIRIRPYVSAVSLIDNIWKYVSDNAPSALELTNTANSLRKDIRFREMEKENASAYSLLNSITKQTGSIWGLTRENELFVTYFDNPYYQANKSSIPTGGATHYYDFSQVPSVTIVDVLDIGSSYALSQTTVDTSILPTRVTGKHSTNSAYYFTTINEPGTFASYTYQRGGAPESGLVPGQLGFYNLQILCKFERLAGHAYPSSTSFSGLQFLKYKNRTTPDDQDIGIWMGLDKSNRFNINIATTTSMYSKPVRLGEDQWTYIAVTNDTDTDEYNIYINGDKIYTNNSHSPFISSAQLKLVARKNYEYYIDALSLGNNTLTATDIRNNASLIFGNAFKWSTTAGYTFCNYGRGLNVIGIQSYDTGSKRIFNKIITKTDVKRNYKSKFTFNWEDHDNIRFRMRIGSEVLSQTILKPDEGVTTDQEFKDFFNTNFSGVVCTITGVNTFQLNLIDIDSDLAMNSWYYLWATSTGMPVNIADPTYTSVWPYGIFVKESKPSEYIFANTASVQEFGVREYELKDRDNITLDLSQTAVVANAILDNYSQPKVRLKIRTRFLEGNLDLFNRVTLDWKPDFQDSAMEWNNDNWDEALWAKEAGHIQWDTKDFWIIGIEHSFKKQESVYTLREV